MVVVASGKLKRKPSAVDESTARKTEPIFDFSKERPRDRIERSAYWPA
jgi:hypothetical protein